MSDPAPLDPVVAAANQAKARSDAQTAAFEAESKRIAATAAAQQAAIASIPDSGFSGRVELKTDGGKGEATLLTARAALCAAAAIAEAVGSHVNGESVRIYVGNDKPTLDHLQVFNLRRRLLEEGAKPNAEALDSQAVAALKTAGIEASSLAPPTIAQVAPAETIALGLMTLAKLGGLFQSDYELGGYTISADDNLLGAAVAGALSAGEVYLASRSAPAGGADALARLLGPLAETSARAQERMTVLSAKGRQAQDLVAGAADHRKDAIRKAADACSEAGAAWQALVTAYDGFITSLSTPDDKGVYQVTKVAQEQELSAALEGGQFILFVQMAAAVGGYYVKRNLWTFLGGMPFFVMGGVVVTYTLIAGPGGAVKASGVIPHHGGYERADQVQAIVNSR